jgi:putative membrane protein
VEGGVATGGADGQIGGVMTTDLILAGLHHLLAFGVVALFFALHVTVRPGLTGAALHRVAIVDRFQGAFAGGLVVVGVLRVIYGLKGSEFYLSSWTFWAKMAAFAAVALLSIPPTTKIIAWHKASKADQAYVVPDGEIGKARGWLTMQFLLILTIPIFAAMMARGIGL